MDIKEKIKVFEKELNLIKLNNVRDITEQALEKVHYKFFEAPSSTSGKYHPAYALGKGGLVRHTKAAVKIFISIVEASIGNPQSHTFAIDTAIAGLILHDTCKSGINWDSDHTVHEHPLLVKELLNINDHTWTAINFLISTHMGKWTTSEHSDIVLPEPNDGMQHRVHLADYLASRKYLTVDLEEKL